MSGQIDVSQTIHAAAERIQLTGFYDKLRAAYPKRIAEVNAELDANWTLEGVKQWEARMMKGIEKIKKEEQRLQQERHLPEGQQEQRGQKDEN